MLKQQQEEAASRECTFHPVINHCSDRLMAERSEVLRVRPQPGSRNLAQSLSYACTTCSLICLHYLQ